jgi:hypothetical protein
VAAFPRFGWQLSPEYANKSSFYEKAVGVRVHCLALGGADLTSAAGKMTMGVISAVAEFERDLLIERTQSGLNRAKAAGKSFGRPSTLNDQECAEVMKRLNTGVSVTDIARSFKTTRQTIIWVRKKGIPSAVMPKADLPGKEDVPSTPTAKVMKVKLWMQVENNSKFVRGKNKSREEIERDVLSQFDMEKLDKDGWEYILSIPYTTDEELDQIIYDEIIAEANDIADRRNGFIEADIVSLDDPVRSW